MCAFRRVTDADSAPFFRPLGVKNTISVLMEEWVFMMMRYLSIRNLFFFAGLCLSPFLAGGVSGGEALEADIAVSRDMVWADSDGQRRDIYFSSQEKGGAWSEPVRISDGKTDSLLPCVVSRPDGTKFVVWTVLRDGRLGVMYSMREDGNWSKPQEVPGLPQDATMPFAAADDAGALWLVFAGNDGAEQDDIYCVRLRDGEWTKPERVNGANEVPDIHPFIEIDSGGGIQVTWEGFRDGGYTQLTTHLLDGEWTEEEALPEDDKKLMEQEREKFAEEKLPDFVRDRSMLFVRGSER